MIFYIFFLLSCLRRHTLGYQNIKSEVLTSFRYDSPPPFGFLVSRLFFIFFSVCLYGSFKIWVSPTMGWLSLLVRLQIQLQPWHKETVTFAFKHEFKPKIISYYSKTGFKICQNNLGCMNWIVYFEWIRYRMNEPELWLP